MEISKLLNTGLSQETLATCVQLCESGVNPEPLAMVIQELKKESTTLKVMVKNCYAGLGATCHDKYTSGVVEFWNIARDRAVRPQ